MKLTVNQYLLVFLRLSNTLSQRVVLSFKDYVGCIHYVFTCTSFCYTEKAINNILELVTDLFITRAFAVQLPKL